LIEPFFNSVVLVHQLSSVSKDGSKKNQLERVQICKNAGKLKNFRDMNVG